MDNDLIAQLIALTGDISTIAVLLYIIHRDDKKRSEDVGFYRDKLNDFFEFVTSIAKK